MKVVDNEIGENGILVNNGFGYLKVKVGNEIITCVRNILMNGNDTIRKLLMDEEKSEILELYEKCEIKSFLEIEKYYSGGCMELNDGNVCDILRFSIYYNDNRIMKICNEYLKNHLNDKLMAEIFDILCSMNLNNKMLCNLAKLSENYLNKNGFKYLSEDKLLLMLNLKSLKFILNNRKLMITDETWLLNRLMLWYKAVLKEEQDNEEDVKVFISIIKTTIHFDKIEVEEIEEDNILELKSLEISIEEYRNKHIYIRAKDISNEDLLRRINYYYIELTEEIKIDEKEKKALSEGETKGELIKILLTNDDVKLIEVILNLIIEMKIEEIITVEMKNRLLGKLMSEYNTSKRNRALRCFTLFVDNYEYISTIKCLCGKETLFTVLNNEEDLKPQSMETLINYIIEMNLSREQKNEMSKIVMEERIINELKFKDITSFAYPQSQYSFLVNEEINIIPSFDSDKCEFDVNPAFPDGLILEKENGIIHGKVSIPIERKEYEIRCRNDVSEKVFKISLDIWIGLFTDKNKSQNVAITNNRRVITNTNILYNHCYLDLKMKKGIYNIKYKFHLNGNNNDSMILGVSTNNTYSGKDIQNKSTTFNYFAVNGRSQNSPKWCHIGTIINKNPNFTNHGDNSVYELIIDMKNRELSISHNNSDPVLLAKDLPSTLFTYAVSKSNTTIELLSISHQF